MRTFISSVCSVLLVCLPAICGRGQSPAPARELVQSRVAQEYPSLFELYKHLHAGGHDIHMTWLVGALSGWFGETNLVQKPPSMGGEDFSEFGRTEPKVPICTMNVGAVSPEALKESKQTGKSLPSLHSPLWAPVPEPSIKSGVTTFVAWVLELLGNPKP